jgi:formylglycine-generating enzyme required for sulfatase activity
MNEAAKDISKLKVFVSYSRADMAFADELAAGLELLGEFEVSIDRHSIHEGEDWKTRLGALIAAADTVVFILSPQSATSSICLWEVDHATGLSKRILPVQALPLGNVEPPSQLAALNYVRFDPDETGRERSFIEGLGGLRRALNTDVDWVREHTRLLTRAREWDAVGRKENRLLSGSDISDAKAWLEKRSADAPAPTELHRDFIQASEKAENAAVWSKRTGTLCKYSLGLVICGWLAGVLWANQQALLEQYFYYSAVRQYALTAEQSSALKAGEIFKECRNCPEMIVLPPGSYVMGSPEGQGTSDDELPQHTVRIERAFAVSRFEVTFDQWDTCARFGGCPPASDGGFGRGNRPVANISWSEAQNYVTWLASVTGKGYRLVTEAEWEYAARAGTSTPYFFGSNVDSLRQFAWFNENSNSRSHPVGSMRANAFGLYDMYGNTWEWVADCWSPNYAATPVDGSPMTSGDCSQRVLRGGSWNDRPESLRSAARNRAPADLRQIVLGFRVARTLVP